MNGQVLAAVITTGGAIFVGVLAQMVTIWRLRNENRRQHSTVGETLTRVETKVDYVRTDVRDVAARLDDHINGPHHTAQIIVHPKQSTSGNSFDVA